MYPDGELRAAVSDMRAQEGLTPNLLNATLPSLIQQLSSHNNRTIVVLDANIPVETLKYIASLASSANLQRSFSFFFLRF